MSARRVLALVGLAAVALAIVLVASSSDSRYMAHIELRDAGGLRKGANVRFDGAPVGRVSDLVLDKRDNALATVRLDPGVVPLGAGATALIQADGFFGERYVELGRGDLSEPQPDGTTIPLSRSSVSTRLDDLVDALDTDTRAALRSFLNEQGTLIVGRGRALGHVLATLPPGLVETGRLLDQLGADNVALGRLVEESDRVVGSVAAQHDQFGRMVSAAAGTLDALDTRRPQLGATFREAPSTLRAARRVLVAVQDAAGPLAPAARGLRATAPTLTATLRELPSFAAAAVPAFGVARRVSPELLRLGTRATPTVRLLAPMARTLAAYTRQGLDPFTDLLAKVTPDVFGVMEGWARSTQGYDRASRIFRFGATTGTDTFAVLLGALPAQAHRHRRTRGPASPPGRRPPIAAPRPNVPVRDLLPPDLVKKVQQVLGDPAKAVGDLSAGRPDDAVRDVVGGSQPGTPPPPPVPDHLPKP